MKKIKKQVKRLDGSKKLIAFTARLEEDMRSFCRDKGIESESELVRQAIAKFIYGSYEDETFKLQGLKHLQEKVTELHDMMNILFSYIIKMNESNMAYHPEIDSSLKEAAYISARTRHDRFFNIFQDSLKNEPSFFERLLSKYYSDIK